MSGAPSPSRQETYWDIVWRQFRKNTPAVISLWLLAPLFLLAIFAPVLASNVPFVFHDGENTIYPWARSLFHSEVSADYFFNMMLLAFVPWLAACLCWNVRWHRLQLRPRMRMLRAFMLLLGLTCALMLVFSPLSKMLWGRSLAPSNKYQAADYPQEEFSAQQQGQHDRFGYYPPLPFGTAEQDLDSRYQPPGFVKSAKLAQDANDAHTHWLGTDTSGRDILTQMLHGLRIAMTVGFVAVGIYIAIGVFLGAIAGYFGGWTDMLISRVIEVVMLFPSFFLILTLVGLLGPSIMIIMVVIGLTGWPGIARLVRGEVLKQRSMDYTLAAKALGVRHSRILFRHVLPNALAPVLVAIPFGVSSAIITEAGLSLLGLGIRPPAPTWGVLLTQGRQDYENWWMIVVPSAAIFFTVTVFNLVGSGLRDAMDPRLRR